MAPTREDVFALALSLFDASKLAEVVALLDEYALESHEREVNRVHMAIL